ncbi:MAG: sortase [Patescibacteria group bacterium]
MIFLSTFFIIKTFYAPIASEAKFFVDNNIFHTQYIVSDKIESKKDAISKTRERIDKKNNYNLSNESQLMGFFRYNKKLELTPVDTDFSIVIPKIAANSRIIKNIDASNDQEYLQSLKMGVAHALGTAFPGEGENIFLFAHSTDNVWNISTYNAVFYLLYKLEAGDEINIYYEGKRYVYVVTGQKVVAPDQVEYLVNPSDEEQLTLQTCWPPGTTFERLLVFAKRKAN